MTQLLPERVVIISDFSAVRGGASKLALLQAGLLQSSGIPVTLFAGDAGEDPPDGLEVIALGGRRLLEKRRITAALGGLWNRAARQSLARWISLNDTAGTIYHVHGYHQTLSPSVLAPLSRVQKRTVMHAHDYFLGCPNGAFFDFQAGKSCGRKAMSPGCVMRNCDKRSYTHKVWRVARQALQNRARRHLQPGVSTVLIHSGMATRLFPEGAGGPVQVLANPADPLLDSPVPAAGNTGFLYAGDIHGYKGVFLLAEAARRAGVRVRFAGSGRDLARLQARFPEHRFDGWQEREGLARIMASARILVAPTLGPEPYGLTPVEALLAGVPVLLSDSMLISRDVLMQDAGQCFAAGDCNGLARALRALARALRALARDDAAVARMSRNALMAAKRISMPPSQWLDALLALYDGILKDGPLQ